MSAGREFQVDEAATEKARRASAVCMRGTTSIGASEERRARGGAQVCTSSLRYVIHDSFIHSYSFNVEVDITQLQTDREARKEDIIIYICSSNY